MESVEDRTAILSLHDITPVFEEDIVTTIDLLSDLGMTELTLLVTPFYGLKKANMFTESAIFTKYLRSLNQEISMHGYSHFSKSGSINEFEKLPQEKILAKLKDGVTILLKGFGAKPSGYVPPPWESPPKVVKAIKSLGLEYCVNGNEIHDLQKGSVYSTAERIVSQGLRTLPIESSLFEIELGGALQIGVHPRDYRVNNLFELLADLKDRLEYQFMGFKSYLSTV
ncbi:MAG: DUF2334 domain-containing protein [Promethearchaeota archaeon]